MPTPSLFSFVRVAILLAALVPALVTLSACATMRNAFRPKETLPTVWNQAPSLDEVVANLKHQSAAMQSLSTTNATLTIPGAVMPLQASVYVARPRSMRLRGSATAVTGQEIDFGSNNDLFWFWGKRLAERELYTARHAQFATSPARATIPLDPDWLLEALGFLTLGDETYEPLQTSGTTCTLVARRQTPAGLFVKRTTIDTRTGTVVRQEMLDAQNRLLAVAESRMHRRDAATGILYAQQIDIQSQGAMGKITLDLGTPAFNIASALPPDIFVKPVINGYTEVDLCSPATQQPHAAPPPIPSHVLPLASPPPLVVSPPAAPPHIASGQTYTVVR